MEEEIELTDFLSTLWQKKKIIIITVVVFALVALVGTAVVENINKEKSNQTELVAPETYYAQSTFLVATSETTTTAYNEQFTQSIPVDVISTIKNFSDANAIKTYGEIVRSQTVLNAIKEKLSLKENLAESIAVARVSDSNLVAIIVENTNKDQAKKIAVALTEEFVKVMSNTYFIDEVSVIDKAYLVSDKNLAEYYKDAIVSLVRSGRDLSTLIVDSEITKIISTEHLQNIFKDYILTDENITKLSVASSINGIVGISPEGNSNILKYTICSAILGLVASSGLILAIEMLNPTIKNKSHIGDNILALVEENGAKNIFDILRIKLEKNSIMLVTSPKGSNKHSYISNNLAIAYSNMNNKTLLIDLTSNETTLLENANTKGLFDFIKDKTQKIDNYISKVNNLDLLLAGTENASCLDDETLEDLLNIFEKNYDYVIINTSNILENSNALQLAKSVKNTVLVATQRKTTLTDFNQTKEVISEVGGNVLGTILLQ